MNKPIMKNTSVLFCISLTMLLLSNNFTLGQVNAYWQLGGNNSTLTFPPASRINAASFVGSTDAALPFNIKTTFAQPVNFFTANTQRMVISGTTGFVGVGTTAAPSQKFEVEAGNINLFTSTNAYMLGSQNILWHKGNARNIFVGVGAGNNSVSAASNNSYFGYYAGFTGGGSTPNDNNTFIGAEAGFNNDGPDNVAVGYQAAKGLSLQNTTGLTAIGTYAGLLGSQNGETVFVGYKAGRQTQANSNTFVGFTAGENSINGNNNSFLGTAAGINNADFSNNTYLGSKSGQTSNGDFNTAVGAFSGQTGVGNHNVLLGVSAMKSASSGDENVIIGSNANSSTSGNNYNTMVGTQAGLTNTTGANNTFMGYKTAVNQTTGDNNAYFGTNTGNNMLTGRDNTFLGGNADATNASSNLTNASAIGSNAKVTNDNHMILGDNNVNVGIGLSADVTGPQNKLEINTSATSPIPGASGLRFRDLTSGSTAITNPGIGVLSVDANGDVIYVQGATAGISMGNSCGAVQNPLTTDWEMPMNGYNYVFSDPPTLSHGVNNVRVGASCGTPVFNAKFEVWRNSGTIPNGINAIAGVLGVNSDRYPALIVGQNSYGGYFIANGGSVANPVNYANYGVLGIGRNGRINYGGYFEAAQPTLMGYGIYAKAISNGFGTGSLAGYFDGDIFINGIGNGSSGIFYTSDARLKTNIDTIANAIAIINQLKPKMFYYDTTNAYGLRLSNKKQYGFIAQDVQTVLPELIGVAKKQQELDSLGNIVSDSITYNTVNYNAIIGLLTKAVQQQQAKIDSLSNAHSKQDSINQAVQQQLAALASQINSCCSNTTSRNANSNINQLDVELSDKDAIVLNQNVPNPFAEQTTITYNVPNSIEKAQLIFFNSNGQVIQTVDIKTRGKGKVNVFAADLSSGLYHYTLVADGKVVDSKKMVRE